MNTEALFLIRKGNAEEAFELRTLNLEAPKEGEVLIQCEAFGLNYADVMARRGLYREAPPMPCVIGYEVVGTVKKVGATVSKDLVGKRVLAFTRFGGYAKHVITKQDAIAEVGEMENGSALALATQGVTAYYMASYLSPIRENDRVLIHAAAGGVGSLLIQLAKHQGAIVFAKVGNAKKVEKVKALGADYAVDYSQSDYGEQLADILQEDRLDIVFNPVGGSTFKKDFSLLGSGGRAILFGGSELAKGKWGFFSKLNFVRKMGLVIPIGLMMRSKNILGVNMLKIADNKPKTLAHCLREVVRLEKENILSPISGGEFPATELAKAHQFLESGKSTGKISVRWE